MSRFLLVVVVVSLVTVPRCSVLLFLVKLFPEETKRRHKTRFPFLLYLPQQSSSRQFVLFLPVRLLPPTTPSRSSVLLPPLYLSLHLPLPSSRSSTSFPFLLFLSFFSFPLSLPLSYSPFSFSLSLSSPLLSFLSSGLYFSIIYLSERSFSPSAMYSLDTSACAAPRASFSPWGEKNDADFLSVTVLGDSLARSPSLSLSLSLAGT